MHVIGTAGHVDHGKSTLVQRLTGINPDRFEEEKRRGLTIDLGFAWLTLPSGNEVGIVDVPGHEKFIKNMLAGTGGISVCLFVVAANEGWMPQSSEHLAILDILGVRHGVVALTKSDSVDGEALEFVQAETEERLAGTSLAGLPVVPCSAQTGAGIDECVAALDAAVAGAPKLPDEGRARLWIDRVFTIAGAGTVVTGTLAGGSLSVGDDVQLAPQTLRARIRKIQSHKKELTSVSPGNRVALNLVGAEREHIQRGDAVLGAPYAVASFVEAWVRVLPRELLGDDVPLKEKGSYLLYVGSAEVPVRIRLLGRKELAPGESGPVQLDMQSPLPLQRGDQFVLRDAGRILTFGGGAILDPLGRSARRDDQEHIELLTRLRDADGVEALRLLLDAEGEMDLDDAELRAGVRPDAVDGVDGVVRLGTRLFSARRFGELQQQAEELTASHHSARPLEKGIDRESLRRSLALVPDAFDALLRRTGSLEEEGSLVRSEGHSVSFDPKEQAERDRVFAEVDEGAFSPPLAKALGAPPEILRALTDSGELVRVGDFYLTARRAEQAKARVKVLIETGGPVTVAQIRDVLDTSRKYAVPLCEWLDSTGVTKRQGDLRALGPRA